MGKIVILNCDGCRKKRKKPKHRSSLRFYTGPQSYFEGESIVARLTMEESFENVVVTPKTAKGNPAPIDGDVVWASSDEAVATVASTGQLTARVVPVAPGVCQITATFDADLDVGEERMVPASGALEVVAAEAVVGEIDFGTPQ